MATKYGFTSGANWTWDNTNDSNWFLGSGGTGGATTHPVAGDTVILDGSSGGGTVTIGADLSMASLSIATFTGTLDNSVGNHNVTMTANSAFTISGTSTRGLKLGGGTWTFSGYSTVWNAATTTGLTFDAGTSSIVLTASGNTNTITFSGGGLAYHNLTCGPNNVSIYNISGNNSFDSLTFNGNCTINFAASSTQTMTNTSGFSIAGSSGSELHLTTSSFNIRATIASSYAGTIAWAGLAGLAFTGTGSLTANNSFDLGNNTGITINAPSGGSSGTPQLIG